MRDALYCLGLGVLCVVQLLLPWLGLEDWSVVVMVIAIVFAIGAF